MSWHFLDCENSHCSPGAEEASWPGNCLDGAPDALLRLMPKHGQSSLPGSGTDALSDSQFGTISQLSMGPNGAEKLISSLEDSHAKTSVFRDVEWALMEPDQACGRKWPESFAKFDPDTHSWRTSQRSLFGGYTEFLGTWPQWILMRNAECWELATPVGIMREDAFGLLPTPVASEAMHGPKISRDYYDRRKDQGRGIKLGQHLYLLGREDLAYSTIFREWMMGWPEGWTESKLSGMDGYLRWQQRHSDFYWEK